MCAQFRCFWSAKQGIRANVNAVGWLVSRFEQDVRSFVIPLGPCHCCPRLGCSHLDSSLASRVVQSWHPVNHGCLDGERTIVIALCVWRLLSTSWHRENDGCPDGERMIVIALWVCKWMKHSRATSVCVVVLLFSGAERITWEFKLGSFGHHFYDVRLELN